MNPEAPLLLLIDDDAKVLTGTKFFLNQHGYRVQLADNAAEALALLTEFEPDLILCDVMMPDMDGFEFRKRIIHNPKISHIPFIFLTARTSKADILHGFDTGGDDYITKPFDRQELLARINTLIKRVQTSREKAVARLNEEMELFQHNVLSNARHELYTPLNWIISGLELTLSQQHLITADLLPVIESAMIGARQLKFMLDDLILLTNIDQQRLDFFPRSVDLKYDLYQPIAERLHYYRNKSVNIEYDIQENISISAPRQEFRHIVTHLIDNAIKFSPDESLIRISLGGKKGGCKLTISDQGLGIPDELKEKVFERYYQVSQGDARDFDGLGVGLTISRTLARAMGGDIRILSADEGCRVQLEMPPASE